MSSKIFLFSLLLIIFVVNSAFPLTQRHYQEGEDIPTPYILGVGIRSDFDYADDYDFDLLLSGKFGEFGFIGYLLNLDFGYRFREEVLRGKIGISGFFSNFGLQIDFSYCIDYKLLRFDPGIDYSFVFLIPVEPIGFFINIGGQSVYNHKTELIAGLTIFYSFTHLDLIANIFD